MKDLRVVCVLRTRKNGRKKVPGVVLNELLYQ